MSRSNTFLLDVAFDNGEHLASLLEILCDVSIAISPGDAGRLLITVPEETPHDVCSHVRHLAVMHETGFRRGVIHECEARLKAVSES